MARTIQRPAAAFALSLAGGIMVLLGGLLLSVVGFVVTIPFGGVGGIIGLLGVFWGLIMILSSFFMFAWPDQHSIWSAIIIVVSVFSWYGAIGGFILGFLLGIIGGILGVIWKPDIIQGSYETAGFPPQ